MDAIFEPNIPDRSFPFKLGEMTGAQPFLYHWHDEVEILCGLAQCTTVGLEDRPYPLAEGDMLLIAPGARHCLFPSSGDARRLAVCFHPSLLFSQGAFQADRDCFARIQPHSAQWPGTARAKMEAALAQLTWEAGTRAPGWQEAITAQLLQIAVLALRELPQQPPSAHAETRSSALRRVLAYLSTHYQEPLTLQACAAALGFHPSYLSAMFQQRTGTTLHQYLLSLRLNQAAWLLLHTELPVSAVAEQSGFASVKTFHRVFRSRYQCAPGAYRTRGVESQLHPARQKE